MDGTAVTPLNYAHDALDRITARNSDTFGYNSRSEVTSADIQSTASRHAFDGIDNNIWTSCNATTNTYTANALNQYTAIDATTLAYDGDGNLLTNGVWSYTWDCENRLTSVFSNSVCIVSNAYDHAHRRLLKVTPTTTCTYLYDGWNLIQETVQTSQSTATNRFLWGRDLSGSLQGAGGIGGLLAVQMGGAWYFPLFDHNGNVTTYADVQGSIVADYTFDAFGRTLTATGTMAGAFRHRFSTKYFDGETGLYYYGYRFYAPLLMRWLNRDPIGETDGANLVCFAGNNPVCGADALGLREVPPWDEEGIPRWEYDRREEVALEEIRREHDVRWRIAFVLEYSGKYREIYSAEAAELNALRGKIPEAELIARRAQLKARFQNMTPPEVDMWLRANVGEAKYKLRTPSGTFNPGKTNPAVNSQFAAMKWTGRVMIVLAVTKELERIAAADDWAKQMGESSAGLLGQIAGGAAGAALTRAAIAIPSVGRMVPNPYVRFGAVVVGSAVGASLGDRLASGGFDTLYDVLVCDEPEYVK